MDDLLQLAIRHYGKNRTIVSRDIPEILDDVASACGLPLKLHSFPSGADIATWIIPERWDVREAWLKGPDGHTVASYADHPLFLAPYSIPFEGTLSLAELRHHVCCHPTQRDAFCYEYRLAYDYRRRLREWRISLPQNVMDRLPDGKYHVKIDVDIGPGEMLVGQITLPGDSDESIVLLSHYCHPGQANDSFSGIITAIQVLRWLRDLPKRKYTYHLLLFPETIGSCAYLATNPEMREMTKLAIFCEMVGWGDKWKVCVGGDAGGLNQQLAAESRLHWPGMEVAGAFDGFGNDELVFQYAGVPSMSLQRTNVLGYHSSDDTPERLNVDDLRHAADIVFRMCRILERDSVYEKKVIVPVYMTRFDLYSDAERENAAFREKRDILFSLDGKASLLRIAVEKEIDFDYVCSFVSRLESLGFVRNVV